ncbi:MAG: ABC transporter substrate-binding protein [Ruminococcaceae bacterium]|jgi:hypothetical protein|nr:ABC transporter substrate-binding protein [Oscillospiraceae bacterium]
MKKTVKIILLSVLALSLCACRVRTTLLESPAPDAPEAVTQEQSVPAAIDAVVPAPPAEQDVLPEPEEPSEPTAAPDAPAERDESAERREFDASASGELAQDAETPLNLPSDAPAENNAPAGGEGEPVNVEAEDASLTATETVPADESEQLGADEAGEVAQSVQTYYLTLLDSRLGNLFECKRLYVYWETEDDRRTIHKSSREHQLILDAGAYDVSAKLLEDGLTVDDGWVARKNPDAVVKIAPGGALDESAARTLCDELAARSEWQGIAAVREKRIIVLSGTLLDTQAGQTAAMVYLAKLLYPAQMEDVDADEALRALTEEAFGSAYAGAYAFTM